MELHASLVGAVWVRVDVVDVGAMVEVECGRGRESDRRWQRVSGRSGSQ